MFHLILVVVLLAGALDAKAQPAQDPAVARVKDELRALAQALNDATLKGDRAALERIYAPEFVFVHAYGYVDDRATQITQILERGTVFPLPTFDPPNELLIYGDVAVFRMPKSATDDGSPAWGTIISVKREGRYQIVQQQGTEMQRERQWLTLPVATLDAYAGQYKGLNGVAVIKREGHGLVAQLPRRHLILKPTAENVFFDKGGGEWTFYRDPDGKVAYYVWRFRGQERRATRTE